MTTHQHREPLSVDLASIVGVINARDDARAMAALWKEVARRLENRRRLTVDRDIAAANEYAAGAAREVEECVRHLITRTRQRDAAVIRAEKAEQERDAETTRANENRDLAVKWQMEALKLGRAEQARALTADDYERGVPALREAMGVEYSEHVLSVLSAHEAVHAIVDAVLTVPPARPEWADAPAVLAHCLGEAGAPTRVWTNVGEDRWRAGRFGARTEDLTDVTPLRPEAVRGAGAES